MATLSGALLAIWTAACILTAIFLTVAASSCLLCTISPAGSGVDRFEAFFGFIFSCIFACLFFIHARYLVVKPQETPATRDIHLTVPEKVEVHTEFRLDNTVIGKEVL